MTLLRRLRGALRLWLGYCPSCNSDAPAVDTCNVCQAFRPVTITLVRQFADLWWSRFAKRGYR